MDENRYPEIFVATGELPGESGPTIYPPRPDPDGMYDVSEVWNWDLFMTAVHVNTYRTCECLRTYLPSMSAETAVKVRESINAIERIRPLFLRRELSLIPVQQRYKDIAALLFAEGAVWAGFTDSLQMFATVIAGSPQKWLPLSEALVENELQQQKDWRYARSPGKWVKHRTKNIAAKNDATSKYALEYSGEPQTISLEEISNSPIEGLLEKKYTSVSVTQLEAAAAEDPETAEYLECKKRYPKWSCKAISEYLGWDETRGKCVDRRYRRMRRQLREHGLGIACREYRPPTGITDANFTSYFEPLYEGCHGRAIGVWQHRVPQS